jgi:hypothetical protein
VWLLKAWWSIALLLERDVDDNYNNQAASSKGRILRKTQDCHGREEWDHCGSSYPVRNENISSKRPTERTPSL